MELKTKILYGVVAFIVLIGIILLTVYFQSNNKDNYSDKYSDCNRMKKSQETNETYETNEIKENFNPPAVSNANVLYTDSNGNLGATSDLGINYLTVSGVLQSNKINLGNGRWETNHQGDDKSYIVSDDGNYKKLMLVGNNTGGGGVRRVGVWDDMEVSRNLQVNGGINSNGNINAPSISTNRITVSGDLNVGGRLNLSNGWNIRTNDGHFRLFHNDNQQFVVHNPDIQGEWKDVVWAKQLRSDGDLRVINNINAGNTLNVGGNATISGSELKVGTDGNFAQITLPQFNIQSHWQHDAFRVANRININNKAAPGWFTDIGYAWGGGRRI